MPTDLWISQGHRLLAALNQPAEDMLIQAFERFLSFNSMVQAATDRPGGHLSFEEGELHSPQLQVLIDKIDTAVEVLDALEVEYEARELRLRHPVKSRLPRSAVVANQSQP